MSVFAKISRRQRSHLAARACLIVILSVFICNSSVAETAQSGKRLLAYYNSSDRTHAPYYDATKIPYHQLTHIAHFASQVADVADGTLEILPGAVEPELIRRAHASGVKVLLSVQGKPSSFSTISADAALRAKLANQLKQFAIANDYDGADIDWEVPEGAEDSRNCVLLMETIRRELPSPRYLLSMATSATPATRGTYDFAKLTPLLDFYNVMAYDYSGPWRTYTGHNSPLFQNGADLHRQGSLDGAIDAYLNDAHVPPSKLNIGTAFYGYRFPASQLWGSCTPSCSATVSLTYGMDIKPLLGTSAWKSHFDEIAMAPYLVASDPAKQALITYDDPASTRRKVQFVLEQRQIGGVFMWEISQDYDGQRQELMDAMYDAYRNALEVKR